MSAYPAIEKAIIGVFSFEDLVTQTDGICV
jgi:hypothetical protein